MQSSRPRKDEPREATRGDRPHDVILQYEYVGSLRLCNVLCPSRRDKREEGLRARCVLGIQDLRGFLGQ